MSWHTWFFHFHDDHTLQLFNSSAAPLHLTNHWWRLAKAVCIVSKLNWCATMQLILKSSLPLLACSHNYTIFSVCPLFCIHFKHKPGITGMTSAWPKVESHVIPVWHLAQGVNNSQRKMSAYCPPLTQNWRSPLDESTCLDTWLKVYYPAVLFRYSVFVGDLYRKDCHS